MAPSSDSTTAITLLFAASILDDGTSRDNGHSGDGSALFRIGLKYFSTVYIQPAFQYLARHVAHLNFREKNS